VDRRRERFNHTLNELGADLIIESLITYQSEERVVKIKDVISKRLKSVQVAVENPTNLHNALALIRSAEGVGVQGVHLVDVQSRKWPRGKQTTQGATHWMEIHHYNRIGDLLAHMKDEGFAIAGGVPGAEMELSEVPVQQPVCMILGNEEVGLSEEALAGCDYLYSIPMYGMSQSLNLSVSGALTLYDIVTRKRKSMKELGDFSPKQQNIELAWHLYRLIGDGRAQHYLDYHNRSPL